MSVLSKSGVAALGLTLAVLTSAHAANMAFKLDVELPCTTANPYTISLPLLAGIQDRADSNATGDKCNPASPDGVIDTTDLLCQLFTDRGIASATGTAMNVTVFDPSSCNFTGVTAFYSGGSLQYVGVAVPILGVAQAGGAFLVASTCGPGQAPLTLNSAVLVGAHDVTFPGRTLNAGCTQDFISIPYHTLLHDSNELLCGLEGVDWTDADEDGDPDTCPGGVFDPVGGAQITVQRIDRETGLSRARTAFLDPSGGLRFIGAGFRLVQGEGYRVDWFTGYSGQTFLSPHY